MRHKTAHWTVPLFLAMLYPLTYLYASDTANGARKAILAFDDQRDTALIQGDFATLNRVLGDDLTYIHASGLLESKAEFLADLKSNKRRYISIRNSDENVRTSNQMAIITARSEIRLVHEGNENNLSLRITEVYAKRRGGWQLVAYQSTHLVP